MRKVFTLVCSIAAVSLAHSQVVISQIYGGGGNANAPYLNDFIELYNPSTSTTISLSGYSVQYATATGSSGFTSANTILLSGNIYPNSYYLIQLENGGPVGSTLPAPDATATNVGLSATVGKVALVFSTSPIGATCPSGPSTSIIDFVGYGTSSSTGANCYLGTGAAPTGSNTTALKRKNNGATNTYNNSSDFMAGAPTPRNIALPLQLLSFTASAKDNNVVFIWKTSSERNTHHFEIEQSFDGSTFKSIATVATAVNSSTEKSYSCTGNLNTTTTYYRLKMADADGKSTTSSIVKIAASKSGFSFGNVYPIPAKNDVTIEWNSRQAGVTTLLITDMSGRNVRTLNVQSTQGYNQYQLDVHALATGQYFLRLKNDMNQVQTVITKQ